MRICVTTWYGLRDTLLNAANHLRIRGHKVYDLATLLVKTEVVQALVEMRLDLLIIWAMNIAAETIRHLRIQCPNVRVVIFNWDDPHVRLVSMEYIALAKTVDHVFSCVKPDTQYIQGVTQELVPYSVPHSYLLPPYPYYTFIEEDEEANLLPGQFTHDIAFLIGNLYANEPAVAVNREYLIHALQPHFKVVVYGGADVQKAFPEVYGGHLDFNGVSLVLTQRVAKLWISTHVCIADGYLNERCMLIMGSGNVLVTETIPGTCDLPVGTYVHMDLGNLVPFFASLLQESPERLDMIRRRAKSYVADKHSYKQWCDAILSR